MSGAVPSVAETAACAVLLVAGGVDVDHVAAGREADGTPHAYVAIDEPPWLAALRQGQGGTEHLGAEQHAYLRTLICGLIVCYHVRAQVAAFAGRPVPLPDPDEVRQVHAYILLLSGPSQQRYAALRDALTSKSAQLMLRHWGAIKAVHAALGERLRLSGDEVRALVAAQA